MNRDPFKIKGPAAVGVSGGRTSAYLWRRILDAHENALPPGVVGTFENTGAEREETLAFLHEIETRWGAPLVWLEYCEEFDPDEYRRPGGRISTRAIPKPGKPRFKVVTYETASRKQEPFRKMVEYYAAYREFTKNLPPVLPNPAMRMCTDRLKIKTNSRYMRGLGHEAWDFVVGIRRDEPKRYARMMNANQAEADRFVNICPLYEAGVTKEDVNAYWARSPFNLALDPDSYEGNCTLCFLKRLKNIVWIMEKTDEFDAFWLWAEERTGQLFRKDRPSYTELRRMIDAKDPKVQKYLSLPMADDPIVDCLCGEGD